MVAIKWLVVCCSSFFLYLDDLNMLLKLHDAATNLVADGNACRFQKKAALSLAANPSVTVPQLVAMLQTAINHQGPVSI